MTQNEIKQVLDLHAAWSVNREGGQRANLYEANLSRADLYGANLSGADLFGADLSGANLSRAYLSRAYLSGANLSRAYLYGANLSRANLFGADLSGADLSGADLSGADLSGADLSGAKLDKSTRLPTGETWEVYRKEVVASLLANSIAIEEIVAKSWNVHDWTSCPMATRFHTNDINGVPVLLRPRAEQFIQFFDAKLLDDLPEEMGWLPKKQ